MTGEGRLAFRDERCGHELRAGSRARQNGEIDAICIAAGRIRSVLGGLLVARPVLRTMDAVGCDCCRGFVHCAGTRRGHGETRPRREDEGCKRDQRDKMTKSGHVGVLMPVRCGEIRPESPDRSIARSAAKSAHSPAKIARIDFTAAFSVASRVLLARVASSSG